MPFTLCPEIISRDAGWFAMSPTSDFHFNCGGGRKHMRPFLRKLWTADEGQDIAEYAVVLAVILVLVVGTIRLVGSNANNAFSSVASSLQ